MGIAAARLKRHGLMTGLIVSSGMFLAGCTGAQSPVEELADISTTVKFDSRTFGVPASPRITTAKRVPKGGGRSQVGKPYKVRGKWYYPKDDPGYSKSGTASWYGPNFHGRLTANGEVYDMHGLSAAHKTFPLPSYAMVTNLENGSRVMVRVNDRGPHWWRQVAERLATVVDPGCSRSIDDEIGFQSQHHFDRLPRGVIHADLFRDNALFDGDRLSGIIDFYYACNSVQLYDLAVVANDWCNRQESSSLDRERLQQLLGAYHQVRPAAPGERDAWPVMLRAAALRFWLSRLQDAHFPRAGEITHIKNPDQFRAILDDRIRHHDAYHQLW